MTTANSYASTMNPNESATAPKAKMSPFDVHSAAFALQWFHSIDLGHGIVTPGLKSAQTLSLEAGVIFRESVAGKTVLDIGAWDGYFSFEAARRGAKRVLATDSFCWSGGGWGTQKGFNLVREVTGLPVDDYEIDPMNLSAREVGVHDVVLFLGVLYHLKHPLYVLEKVAEVTREFAVIETQLAFRNIDKPCLAFYPGRELNDDDTNWFAPNVPAAIGMLQTVGFKRIEYRPHPTTPERGVFHAWK